MLLLFSKLDERDVPIFGGHDDEVQLVTGKDSGDRGLHGEDLKQLESLVVPNGEFLVLAAADDEDGAAVGKGHEGNLPPPKHNTLPLILEFCVALGPRDDTALLPHGEDQAVLLVEEQLLDFALVGHFAPLQVAVRVVAEHLAFGVADHEAVGQLRCC